MRVQHRQHQQHAGRGADNRAPRQRHQAKLRKEEADRQAQNAAQEPRRRLPNANAAEPAALAESLDDDRKTPG